MAEILGITASIVSILQLTGTVIKYLNDFSQASKECSRIILEISMVNGYLFSLQSILEKPSSEDSWIATSRSLGVPNGPLDQIRGVMENFVKRLEPASGMKKATKAIFWPLRKEDVKELLDTIERYKTLFILALQNDHIGLSQTIREELDRVQDGMQEAVKSLSELEKRQKDHVDISQATRTDVARVHNRVEDAVDGIGHLRRVQEVRDNLSQTNENQTILNWLSPLNFGTKQNDVFSRRQEGTGQWLLDHCRFKDWVEGRDETLWCPGIPGAGKTMLASIIIDHLEQEIRRGQKEIGVAYVYFNYKGQDQTTTNIIASLLQQLLQQQTELPAEVKLLHDDHVKKRTRPSLSSCSKILHTTIRRFSKVYVVVDALDECPKEGGARRTFSKILSESSPSISLLVTSRHVAAIENMFEGATRIEIRASDKDIRNYLNARITENSQLVRYIKIDPTLLGTILDTIVSKANGMFLLAQLHFDSLAVQDNRRNLRSALVRLPEKLGETYDKAMRRIECQNSYQRERAFQVLAWISYALRPLHVVELQHALSVEAGGTHFDEEALPDLDFILSVCGGLVTVDDASSIIRLVHYTAQQYFERTRENFFPWAHLQIAEGCLMYLCYETFTGALSRDGAEIIARRRDYPFLSYAADFWGDHAREGGQQKLQNIILNFFGHDGNLACAFQMLTSGRYAYVNRYYLPNFSVHVYPTCIAAAFGLTLIVKLLLEQGAELEATDEFRRTALHWAVINDHDETAKLLLDWGADITARTNGLETALSLAVSRDYKSMPSRLPSGGATINPTALHEAVPTGSEATSNGLESTVRLLLDRGADIQEGDLSYPHSTPLHNAVRTGQENIVKLLLDKNANIDSRDGDLKTPLQIAVTYQDMEMTRLLLSQGATVHATDSWQESALHYGARDSKTGVEIVKLFLSEGVEVNAENDRGETALFIAASTGLISVLRVLLDHGATVSGSRHAHWTPLHEAARRGHKTIVQLLLDRGADVDAKDKDELTPLEVVTGLRLRVQSKQRYQKIRQILRSAAARKASHSKKFEEMADRQSAPSLEQDTVPQTSTPREVV